MKIEYGYNFIRIECVESEISDSAITVAEDPKFSEFPVIVYCTDTGALYTGAYDDGTVTLAEYGSGSGGGGGTSDVVYVPISIDYGGDTPAVTSVVSASTIFDYCKSGKMVILKEFKDGDSNTLEGFYYPQSYEIVKSGQSFESSLYWSITSDYDDYAAIVTIKLVPDGEVPSWTYSSKNITYANA